MADIFNNLTSTVNQKGILNGINQTADKVTDSIAAISKSLGFIETTDGNGLKVIRITEAPFVTRIYYSHVSRETNPIRTVEAKKGEPITYTQVKPTDLEINANAENGALIIVLPEELPLMSKIKINRADRSNHQLRILAENGKIDKQDKIRLFGDVPSSSAAEAKKDVDSARGLNQVLLCKTGNRDWSLS